VSKTNERVNTLSNPPSLTGVKPQVPEWIGRLPLIETPELLGHQTTNTQNPIFTHIFTK
jgi:hypothetical protein